MSEQNRKENQTLMAISTLEATQREHLKLFTVCLSFDHDFENYIEGEKARTNHPFPWPACATLPRLIGEVAENSKGLYIVRLYILYESSTGV